jgi:large subunit ribosomal protein L23
MNNIIIKPIITENSMKQAALGKYTFAVDKKADKGMIKRVVEQTFNVKVKAITTVIVKGKTKRSGIKRKEIQVSSWKKAVLLLEKGQKIGFFEIGEGK